MAKKTTRKTSQKRIHTNKERNCKSQSLSGIEAVLHKSAPLGNPIQEWHGRIADKNWHLYNGDAKATLRLLPKESIDCIVTSPPYYWLRDYKVNGQIGLEDSVTAYVAAIADVMEEAFRVLKPSGVMFLNLGDTYYSGKGESQGTDRKSSKRRFGLRAVDKSGGLGIGLQRKSIIGIPWRVAIQMCQQRWILRSPIIWQRQKHLRESVKDRPVRGYEYIFMFAKSRFYYFDKEKLPSESGAEDVWLISTQTGSNGKLDTAPFPAELVKKCLEVGCEPGGTVLDPFSGSGTTMNVALSQGYGAIGIELNYDFCQYTLESIAEMVKK